MVKISQETWYKLPSGGVTIDLGDTKITLTQTQYESLYSAMGLHAANSERAISVRSHELISNIKSLNEVAEKLRELVYEPLGSGAVWVKGEVSPQEIVEILEPIRKLMGFAE